MITEDETVKKRSFDFIRKPIKDIWYQGYKKIAYNKKCVGYNKKEILLIGKVYYPI